MKNIFIVTALLWALNIHFFYSLQFVYDHFYYVAFEAIAYFVVTLFLIALSSFHRYSYLFVVNTLFIVSVFASYFISTMGIRIDGEMLSNIFATNIFEAFELVNIILVIYLIFMFTVLYFLNIKLLFKGAALGWRRYFSLLALILIVAFTLFKADRSFVDRFTHSDTPRVVPLFLVPSISEYIILRDRLVDINKKNISHEYQLKENKEPQIVLFILGESARADRFSINGYGRETTPQIAAVENLLSFKEATSCHTSTLNSVPCLMTRVKREEYDITIKETSFVQVLRDLGYETYWFSKQSPQKRVDTFCQEAAHCSYLKKGGGYDQDLLDAMAQIEHIESQDRDILVVLHTEGSHINYNDRTPKSLQKFEPLCTQGVSACSKEELDNSYDNTILSTDALIANAVTMLQDKNAVIVYTSDHGESLGEGDLVQRYGHATPYALAPKEQKSVPLILWFSQKYLALHPEINLGKIAQKEAPSHDNIFATVLEAAGVESKLQKKDSLNLFH